MPTTYALTLPTLEDFDLKLRRIPTANQADFEVVQSTVDGDLRLCIYDYNAGVAGDRTSIQVRKSYNPKKGTTNISYTLSTIIRATVSETGQLIDYPIECGLFWNYPGKYMPEAADIHEATQVMIASLYWNLAGANGLPTVGPINELDRGVFTALLY